MTIEEYQLLMAQNVAHAQAKVTASQVRAAEHIEAREKAEREVAELALDTARKTANRYNIQTANSMRPSLNFPVALLQSDDGWSADYGQLSAYGDTPELAYQKFDEIWSGRYEP
jgi:hypothetical protein